MDNFILNNPWVFIVIYIWSLIWKSQALYRAARRKDKVWFVVLLILNTIGIADILYLVFTKNKKE